MTQLRTFRLVALAPGESPPLLPGGLERAATFACVARTVDAFFAELDAGAEPPDAVLVFDGARVAAQLRRHERCGLLPILVFGPPVATLPPGCDAWVESVEEVETALRRRPEAGAPLAPEPARDSERRALRFAHWMKRRGWADAEDARAFGIEAPHSLFAAWEREGRVHADPDGGWRSLPSPVPGASEPSGPAPVAPAAAPQPRLRGSDSEAASAAGRFAWPAVFLALFAVAALREGGLLGPAAETRSATRPQLPDRPVLGRAAPASASLRAPAEAASAAVATEPPPAPAPPPASVRETVRVVATGSVRWHEEVWLAERDAVCEQRSLEGASFAAGAVLGALLLPERGEPAEPESAHAERILAARARAAASEAHYRNRSQLAAQGALAWREVAPDWEAWEAARAALLALETEPPGATPARGASAEVLLFAPRAGTGLRWMVPQRAPVRAGDELLRFATGEAWLEVRLEESEWSAAAREPRAEMRLTTAEAEWRPVRLSGEERQPDGGVLLRFEGIGPLAWQPAPLGAEVRWSLAGE